MATIDFLRFFRKNDDEDVLKSHIKNLIAVANADGKFTQDERELVNSIVEKIGISTNKLEQILKNTNANGEIPKDKTMRFNQLYDLVHLMIVDNYIHYKEQKYCVNTGIRFGYPATDAEQIVELIVGNIKSGENPEGARIRLGHFFNCI